MNYKYNETKYAESMYNNGFQSGFIKYELTVLVKYLKSIGYKKKDTEKYLYEFCEKYIEGFNKVQYFKTIDNAIKDGRKGDNPMIDIENVKLTKYEMEYIDSLDIEHEYKKLLLSFLIKKKIALEINKLKNKDATLSVYFGGSKKAYKEVFNMSNIKTGFKVDMMINELVGKDILISVIKGDIVLDYINKIPKENDEVYEIISDFDNVGYVFDYYKGLNGVKKCECFDKCGKYIKSSNNKQKYCSDCAKETETLNKRERSKKAYNLQNSAK